MDVFLEASWGALKISWRAAVGPRAVVWTPLVYVKGFLPFLPQDVRLNTKSVPLVLPVDSMVNRAVERK